jgi:outer membrane biosynthesis protein TonB
MVTPNVSPAPAPATGTSPVTLAPPNMKPVMPEPPKQENTARPPATQTVEKPETAPTSVSNVIPISAESKQPGDSKAADDEPIEFNSPRENLYSLKVTLGGDRLRRYFPDVTMPALAITESIYSALEERRQREARMKQKTEILHPSKPIPTR